MSTATITNEKRLTTRAHEGFDPNVVKAAS